MKTTFKTAILALALAVTVSASAEGYQFTKNLKKGMKGADVTALQTALGISPATGYFGNITLAAVKAYQTANKIPSTGFVGPMTIAKMNMTGGTTPGTTPGTITTTPNGQEGFGEVKLSPGVVSNFNVTRTTDTNVYGIEIKAKESDIAVERVTLQVDVTNQGSLENPSTLINKIIVKDGSTVLSTIPVTSSVFSKDTSSATTKYYVQISGLNFKVSKDTIKNLTFAFDSNSIDAERSVIVKLYGSQPVRIVDGRGISSYPDAATVSPLDHTFKKPGTATLTLQEDSNIAYSQNYRINANDNGVEKVTMSMFGTKSITGTSKITSVLATIATSSAGATLPSVLRLYDGSEEIDVKSVSGATSITFDLNNRNVMVSADQTRVFTIKADFPASTVAGSQVGTRVSKVVYEKPNGTIASSTTNIPSSIKYNYFAPIVAQFTKVSSIVEKNTNNNIVTTIVPTFKLKVQALGGSLDAVATATISFIPKNGGTTISTTTVGTFDGSPTVIGENGTRELTFSRSIAAAAIPASVDYKVVIDGITWKATSVASTTQSGVFEAFDVSSFSY